MNKNNPETNSVLASHSKVTPKKNNSSLGYDKSLYVLIAICLVILGFMFFPYKHAKSTEKKQHEVKPHDLTLSENLALIETMRRQEYQLKKERGFQNEEEFREQLGKRHYEEAASHNVKSNISKETRLRMNATTSFDINTLKQNDTKEVAGHVELAEGKGRDTLIGRDGNSQFLNQQNDITTVTAQTLLHPELTIPAGEMIPATLEVSLNSDMAGMVRAITTRDSYSLTGSNLLIPKGSTLVGQYSSAILEGQNRVYVVWNRVQMNNGVIVTLNSPATDQIGNTGVAADVVNTHFWQRFGNSSLLSVLGAGASLAGVNNQEQLNSAALFRNSIAQSFQKSAAQSLEKMGSIKNTLIKYQGTKIHVFVAHDLDFSSVGKHQEHSMKIIRKPVLWK